MQIAINYIPQSESVEVMTELKRAILGELAYDPGEDNAPLDTPYQGGTRVSGS